MFDFKNLKELERRFTTQQECIKYYEAIRWSDGVFCPHCEGETFYKLKKEFQYRCANTECRKTFNVLHKTIFENSKIGLSTWFTAIYLATSHKKGISSHQLARDLGITQKSAWFMLGRIREMLQDRDRTLLDGVIEIDETHIGGTSDNKHISKKTGRVGAKEHTVVWGALQRNGKVFSMPVKNKRSETLLPIVAAVVKPRATIYTDEASVYKTLRNNFTHESVNHTYDEYVRGEVHTNSIEGYWSLLKRGIVGIYHHTSPKHLHRYCNEFSFRYNTREMGEAERFNHALKQSDHRLLYKELIANK